MPPKAKSPTKSSKSPTSDSTPSPKFASRPVRLSGPSGGTTASGTSVQYVKGVGPRLGAIFQNRGIETVRDLLFFFPRAYEDRTRILTVAEAQEGLKGTFAVQVISSRKIPARGRMLFEVRAGDSTGQLSLKWFHLPRGMDQRFQAGQQIIVTGTPKTYLGRPEIIHPEISWGKSVDLGLEESDPLHSGRVVPIYTEIEGVTSKALRRILYEALNRYGSTLTEDLPERFLKRRSLPGLLQAVREIHFPSSGKDGSGEEAIQRLLEFGTPYHQRLIYEEFFKFEFLVLRQKLAMEKEMAPSIGNEGGRKSVEDLTVSLPFQLTGDQKKAIEEILRDLASPHPMNRLVQGDVGSGKTAVALLSAAAAIAEGFQVALMAPTEILAEQHFKNATRLFGTKLNVSLLTGRSTNQERTTLLGKLSAGMPMLLIGTHALLEEPVQFRSLSLIMIDEQHRFGVEQRRTLRSKGTRIDPASGRNVFPHQLVLTATPIPRTLALTAYGDLTVSNIREMPPGRSPIITKVVRGQGRTTAIESVRQQIQLGRQAYFIYPLVNESEAEGFSSLRSATIEAERLQKEVFPEFRVGLLHGQMKADEKDAVMERFKRNELQILVSTTVVEVGVDVPNATVMVVDHAERFGLSQLHQLRGRVGRGQYQSYCFFLTNPKGSELTQARLEVLEETSDGFEIAEADLRIRGPGEFLGTRQSGSLPFKLADLVRDREWLLLARDDAMELLKSDPELSLVEHAPLRKYFDREGLMQSERLKTS